MSDLARRLAAAALAATLGGALLVQPPAAAATASATASAAVSTSVSTSASGATTAAADFRYDVYFPKYTYRGGYLTYTIKVRNNKVKGQHYVAIVGEFSRHFRKIKAIEKPRSVKCSVKGRTVACLVSSLDKGDTTAFRLRGWVGSRRGVATARFGAVVTDEPGVPMKKLVKAIRHHLSAKSRIR
ncbi:hypothetical protein [Streptosporangium sp. NPDC051022]|uniref:hypothetical protein n=1 Tax=Streptosporangium sp. NPDC051022 TaxID=3155752 RepID=UPI00342F7E8B